MDRLGLTDSERRVFEDELRVTMAANAQKKEEFMYALGLTDEERRQIESDMAQDQTGLNSEQEQENEQEKETEKIAEKASAQWYRRHTQWCRRLTHAYHYILVSVDLRVPFAVALVKLTRM